MTTSTQAGAATRGPAPTDCWWWLLGIVWVGYLVLDLVGVSGPAHAVAKTLLMPALLACVVAALGRRTPRLLAAGLAFATIGDAGLESDATFVMGMVGFLAMQVCYIVGFLRLGAWLGVRARWPIGAGFFAFWAVANVALGGALGELRWPVAIYSLALCLMASVAAGLGRRIGLGGAAFLVSDLLIGLDLAGVEFPGRGLVVMTLYLGAQYAIATGWVRRVDPSVRVPV